MGGEEDILKGFVQTIGANVKRRRIKLAMSLEDLGLEIGLSRMQVHRIEKGYNITARTLLKLAIALQVSPAILVKTKRQYKKEDLENL